MLTTATTPNAFKIDHVFLTGATGVLGAQVLKQLLIDDQSDVFCLVRAATLAEGRERLVKLLQAYDPKGELSAAFDRRIMPILGDISLPQFGLSDEAYAKLTGLVDVSLHVAAFTNLFAKFDTIRSINVSGTENMIAFALATAQKRLSFVSTFTVMGDKAFDPSLTFREEHYDVGQGFADMNYQNTKFMCEGLIRQAGEQGLVWNILRPGQIFGQADNGSYPQGQTNVSGLFYDIFKTIIETKVAFKSSAHFDVSPVDYVARALVYLSLHHDDRSQTYHLCNPDVKSYYDVVQLINAFGYRIGFVSQDRYRKILTEQSLRMEGSDAPYVSITTKAFTWWYSRKQFDYSVSARTDATYTQGILEAVGIFCPKIDQQLISTYLRLGIARNYFPLPPATLDNVAIASQPESEQVV